MGMNIIEKIMAKHAGKDSVVPGEIVECAVDAVMLHDVGTPGIQRPFKALGTDKIADGVDCIIIPDHFVPANTVAAAENLKITREFAERMSIENYYEIGRGGICHQVMMEKGHVKPGQIIVAPDSHATTYGAAGAFGTGLGVTDVAIALGTGKLWFVVPETVRVNLTGKLPEWVSAKDISIYLLGKFKDGELLYRSLELGGNIIHEMSMDSRECLADMALEMGVKACLVECDEITDAYLKKALKGEPYELVTPDQDASYEAVYDVDVSDMVPMISMPHTPSNAATVKEAEGKKVNQAFLGSCTNGRMEDLKIAADMLRGKTISPKVRLIVTPASNEIYNEAMEKGYLKIFMDAGATITNATCGACVGGHLGLIAAGEVCISSSNRNFRGRMGSKDGEIYLASPAAVIASAITGEITDPRGVS